jgi:hypothetical protein
MARCQKAGSKEVTLIEIQCTDDHSRVLLLNKASGTCDDQVLVLSKRRASPNQLQEQWGKRPRPESSSSGEMTAPQREPMLEQPPSPREPAQAGTPKVGQLVRRKAIHDRVKTNSLWDGGKNNRQPELKHYGYEKAEGIRAVSQACDQVAGEYLGNGFYIHRDVPLKDNQTATVLRHLDEANGYQLLDLRIVPASAPNTEASVREAEASVLEKMQGSIRRREASLAGLAKIGRMA